MNRVKGSIAKKGNIIKLKLILFSFKNIKNIVKKKGIAFTKENNVRITDTKQYFDIEFLYSKVFKYFWKNLNE